MTEKNNTKTAKSGKEWYKTFWGFIVALLFFPFFIVWYAWFKSNWSKNVKIVVTVAMALFVVIAMSSDNTNVATTNTDTNKVSAPVEQKAEKKLYKVLNVVDGDTIDVEIDGKKERLRLIGIDTPETKDPRKPVQCFGKEASGKAKEMLSDKQVSLEADNTQGERDKYDRLLRYVFLEDGTNFNKWMIENGYAHEYTYNLPYKYQGDFKEAEKGARESDKGLWAPKTCNGDTTKAVSTTSTQPTPVAPTTVEKTPAPTTNSGEVVKMSTSGICHAPGTTYYDRTTNYTPYDSMDACLASGGRLPKR